MRMRVVSVEMDGVEDAEAGSILATVFEGLLRAGDQEVVQAREVDGEALRAAVDAMDFERSGAGGESVAPLVADAGAAAPGTPAEATTPAASERACTPPAQGTASSEGAESVHDWQYRPDPSGNNDSYYECRRCEAVKRSRSAPDPWPTCEDKPAPQPLRPRVAPPPAPPERIDTSLDPRARAAGDGVKGVPTEPAPSLGKAAKVAPSGPLMGPGPAAPMGTRSIAAQARRLEGEAVRVLLKRLRVGERIKLTDLASSTSERETFRGVARGDGRFIYESEGQGKPSFVKRVAE